MQGKVNEAAEKAATCDCTELHEEKLKAARTVLLEDWEVQRMAELFKSFGDPTRLRILAALSGSELCVCDLAALLSMSVSAVSHQLRLLRGARLVKFRREGKNAFYSLDDDHVYVLLQQGLSHVRE